MDSAGVRIVVNDRVDVPLSAGFELVFPVLHPADDLGGFAELYPGALGVDARKNLYVLDRRSSELFSFDSLGTFRWSVGGMGDGPGEFRSPFSVSVSESGQVTVHDGRRGVLIRFDAGGELMSESSFDYAVTSLRTPVIQAAEQGTYVLRVEPFTGSDERELSLLWSADADSATVLTTRWMGSRTAHFPDCAVSLALPPVFTPSFRWAAARNDLVVVRDHEYRVDRVRRGRLVQSIRRDLDPVAATRQDALRRLGEGVQGPAGACLRTSEEYLVHYGCHPWHQVIRDVAVSPEGMVWVKRVAGADPDEFSIDVFGEDGVYAGTMPPGSPFPALFISERQFLSLEQDEWEMFRVAVWTFSVP
jgi:hypothetical protein